MTTATTDIKDIKGKALDLLVGQALDIDIREESGEAVWKCNPPDWLIELLQLDRDGPIFDVPAWAPTTDLKLGMSLILQQKITVFDFGPRWCAVPPGGTYRLAGGRLDATWFGEAMMGDTALEAGCRMIVFKSFGRLIDIPVSMA